jgi:hypothetical protein
MASNGSLLARLALALALLAGCGESGTSPSDAGTGSDARTGSDAGPGPTDVPMDVEPLTITGGLPPIGARYAVSLTIGDAPPIRVQVDTGSSGIVLAPNAPKAVLDALTPTGAPFSITYGSGVTAIGTITTAKVTIGGLTTDAPIGIARIDQLQGGNGDALGQLFNGYSAILGIGMRNFAATMGNPIVQLPGHPAYLVRGPEFGGNAGTLRIAPHPDELAGFEMIQLAPAPSMNPSLADGTPAWADNAIAGCVTDATLGNQLCASTILDTGDPTIYLFWSGYNGPSPFPGGSQVGVALGSSSANAFGFTVGNAPQAGLDQVNVLPSNQDHISLGTTLFARFDVLFDQPGGRIGLFPHGKQSPPPDGGLPCNVSYDCPAGQTCASTDGMIFSCMPDGNGKPGDACDPSSNAAITCGDQMDCVGSGMPVVGKCELWCDSGHPCPQGAGSCTTIHTTLGATLSFCQ